MPWNAIADEQLKVVFLAVSGHITADDIVRIHSDFRDRFAGRGFVLFVHIESAMLAIGPEAIRKLAALDPVFNKMAFYAATPPTHEVCLAYAEASSLLKQRRVIAVFSDTVSAFAWLMDPSSGRAEH